MVTARIATVENHRGGDETPFFSANDRSRWMTVRALGDQGVYEIDDVIADSRNRIAEHPIHWDSIDKVRHAATDGQMHFYSSKPTLFPTMVAMMYGGLKSITGWEISEQPFLVVRTLLIFVNAIPWAIFLWFAARMINSYPVRDWTRYYVLACAGFGTYLATFGNTLNNHLPAAVCVMVSLYLMSQIWLRRATHWSWYAVAGLVAAFAVANELPALSFFCCVGLACLIRSIQKTLLAFIPAAAVIAIGAFGTNYAAHGTWKPAYAHRSDGQVLATVEGDFANPLDAETLPDEIKQRLPAEFSFQRPVVGRGYWPTTPDDVRRWVVRDGVGSTQIAIVEPEPNRFEIRAWGNWYDYPGSYWLSNNDAQKAAVDLGQESVPLYVFHILFGHHGLFSLTPIWLLSLAGMVALVGGVKLGGHLQLRWLGAMGLAVSIVVIAFYVSRPTIDRNYGGVSCTLRWLLWLAPIWLVCMLPVVDWLAGTRWGKVICFVLLFVSILSASVPMDNPWVHPWLYEIWDWTGLPK